MDKSLLLEHVKNKVNTTFGIRSEERTAQKLATDHGMILKPDHKQYSLNIANGGLYDYVVMGAIDRFEYSQDGSSKTLIEIKNRTKRLFKKPVEYEVIQVQTYLEMVNLPLAKLVEHYNNETFTIEIKRDPEMWHESILPGLEEFCLELDDKIGINALM